MHGKQTAGDQPLLRRVAQAKADIDPVFDPVANAVIEPHLGLHLGVEPAVFVQHQANHRRQNRAGPDDAQRPGRVLTRLARTLQGLLQPHQRRLCGLQKALTFLGQRHAARGAVEQAHTQVRLQLAQRLAGRLR